MALGGLRSDVIQALDTWHEDEGDAAFGAVKWTVDNWNNYLKIALGEYFITGYNWIWSQSNFWKHLCWRQWVLILKQRRARIWKVACGIKKVATSTTKEQTAEKKYTNTELDAEMNFLIPPVDQLVMHWGNSID